MAFEGITGENLNEVCIQKAATQALGWDASQCTTKEYETITGEKAYTCSCLDLSPTTIVNDLESLFKDSLVEEVFSADGLKEFLDFEFYKSYIFYIYLTKIIILLFFCYGGYK